jgi:hypothetical protein
MPSLDQENHFELPDTVAGRARAELRSKLAKELGVSGEDVKFCRCEALSIIIPVIVRHHKDNPNDPKDGFSGTLTLNCTLPIEILENKHTIAYLKLLGYTKTFPLSVVMYSRAVCRTYSNLKEHLNILLDMNTNSSRGKRSKFNEEIYKALTNTGADNDRSFIRIFDHQEKHEALIEQLSKKFEEQGQNGVEVPFTYEAMVRMIVREIVPVSKLIQSNPACFHHSQNGR